jgi:beta-lactamase regulating signal transducer with metallopeptidase domain
MECSVSMSVLALVLMALTPLLSKRYAAKWLYYAWLVIVAGLIIPFRFRFSIPRFRTDAISSAVQRIIPAGIGNVADAASQISAGTQGTLGIPWIEICGSLWLAGAAAFLIYHGLRHARFLRMIRRWGEQTANPQMLEMLERIKKYMGIVRPVKLLICSCVSSPMMIGFLNPAILLPRPDFSVDELPYILRHELVHFKRRDLCYKSLVVFTTAIHWFNPVVYLMAKAIASQCEISCDAEVVDKSDMDGRQRYSETIIGVIRNQSKVQTAFSTNFYGGKDGMKRRIFSIMDTKKKKAGAAVLCLILIGTMGTGMAFAANQDTASSSYSTTTAISAEAQAKIDQQDREARAKEYAVYAQYGLTYDQDTDSFYYGGKLVRYFADKLNANSNYNTFTRANGVVDLKAVRNSNYELTGIAPVSQEEYDKHTESLNRAQNAQAPAQEGTVHNTSGSSIAEEAGGNTVNSSTFAHSEGDPDYVDDSLNAYLDYGVSYDAASKQWFYQNKPIHYLSDGDHMTYLDNGENAIKNGISLEVVRTADGRIDQLTEIAAGLN